MNPRTPFTVTVTITERHLARGVVGCSAECPLALALGEHERLASGPGFEVIVGGREIDLYLDNEHVLTASTGTRVRRWLIRYDSEEEVETPFTATLAFGPPVPGEEDPMDDAADANDEAVADLLGGGPTSARTA